MSLFLHRNRFGESKHYITCSPVNWRTGVVWITCGLLWCFISCLDSHSDGTHSLQRIHWWASDVMLHFSKYFQMKKQTHPYLECLMMRNFPTNVQLLFLLSTWTCNFHPHHLLKTWKFSKDLNNTETCKQPPRMHTNLHLPHIDTFLDFI